MLSVSMIVYYKSVRFWANNDVKLLKYTELRGPAWSLPEVQANNVVYFSSLTKTFTSLSSKCSNANLYLNQLSDR